ncbi:uncharacterized protein LOC117783385 [Drosophila innubila]|uniref:uncharacterized protein LOC117783385 n=1 Tax=Drosophila innubila TaxID=198719 RepID=UPI00148D24C3|nr:uncharacterized protein LOC117783385 [Drosophila innubila]
MKIISITCLILIGLISWSTALVHYKKLEKGANGCLLDGKELEVGGTAKDPNTCGVYVCQNTEGDSLIHYCQKPAPFANCANDGVSTVTEFPQCCWMCVNYVSCGDAPKEPDAPPKTDEPPETDADLQPK